jgi:hypothetical protein
VVPQFCPGDEVEETSEDAWKEQWQWQQRYQAGDKGSEQSDIKEKKYDEECQ